MPQGGGSPRAPSLSRWQVLQGALVQAVGTPVPFCAESKPEGQGGGCWQSGRGALGPPLALGGLGGQAGKDPSTETPPFPLCPRSRSIASWRSPDARTGDHVFSGLPANRQRSLWQGQAQEEDHLPGTVLQRHGCGLVLWLVMRTSWAAASSEEVSLWGQCPHLVHVLP